MTTDRTDTSESLALEARQFFDDFVAAFSTFSGKVVARLFSHPYMVVYSDGSSTILESVEHTAQHFQKYLDGYKCKGSKSCHYEFLEVVPIGASGGLVSVNWRLKNSDGETIDSWSESYFVSRTTAGLLAYVSIDHAGS